MAISQLQEMRHQVSASLLTGEAHRRELQPEKFHRLRRQETSARAHIVPFQLDHWPSQAALPIESVAHEVQLALVPLFGHSLLGPCTGGRARIALLGAKALQLTPERKGRVARHAQVETLREKAETFDVIDGDDLARCPGALRQLFR